MNEEITNLIKQLGEKCDKQGVAMVLCAIDGSEVKSLIVGKREAIGACIMATEIDIEEKLMPIENLKMAGSLYILKNAMKGGRIND